MKLSEFHKDSQNMIMEAPMDTVFIVRAKNQKVVASLPAHDISELEVETGYFTIAKDEITPE